MPWIEAVSPHSIRGRKEVKKTRLEIRADMR